MLFDINNTSDIHLNNVLQVVLYTLENGETNRQDLSEGLNLSYGTISAVCNLLLSLGLAEEYKLTSKVKGPKVKALKMKENSSYVAVLDLYNVDKIKFTLLSLDMKIINHFEFPLSNDLPSFVSSFKNLYKSITLEIRNKIIGIGVAVAGTMYHKNSNIVSSLIPFLEGVSLLKKLQDITQLPVVIENESAIAVIASIVKHKKSISRCIYIFCDEGLGIGIVVKKNAVFGDNGLGSDICNIISPYSRKCETIEQILSKHSKADSDIKGKTLGYLISILVNLLDINTIFIGGYITQIMTELEDNISQVQEELILHKELRDIDLIIDTNYKYTILYGAYILTLRDMISEYKKGI